MFLTRSNVLISRGRDFMTGAHSYRLTAVLVCLTLLAHAVPAQPPGQRSTGRVAERLYRVHDRDGKAGFINQAGKLVIGFDRLPPTLIFVRDFREGLAVVHLSKEAGSTDDKAGYIDATGRVSIAPRFDNAYDFSEGLAYAETGDLRGFIDRRGEFVIKLEAGVRASLKWYAVGFQDGLAAVTSPRGEGFIDRTGRVVIDGYTAVAKFSEGLAAVAVGRGRSARYGFVNRRGEMVIAPRFEPVIVHYEQIDQMGRFSEGLASVRVGDRYGYVNRRGEFVVKPQFIRADDFSEGLACVRLGEQTGYIDKAGRWVVAPRVAPHPGGKFREGLAPAAFVTAHGPKWGYIDHRGRVVVEPRFDAAVEFDGGIARVYEVRDPVSAHESRWGYIVKSGKYLWEPRSGPKIRLDVNLYSH